MFKYFNYFKAKREFINHYQLIFIKSQRLVCDEVHLPVDGNRSYDQNNRNDELTDKVNIVHVEIWRDFANSELEPAVQEWNLPSEPWLFILNSDGTIGARLDGPVSSEELREVLAEVIG